MANVRFHRRSTRSPAEVPRVLTDFGPTRPEAWRSIDAEHLVPEHPIAELFVCGPIAMLIWSETAVLHGRGPSPRQLMS